MTTNTLHISALDTVRHYTNPLHVYCRLVGWGMCKAKARRMVAVYEGLFKALLG